MSTWRPTSTSSSTSDPNERRRGRSARRRLEGLARLVHPFPVLVDAGATAAIAWLGRMDASRALLLGSGMLALQASIGALNDVVDAPRDLDAKPGKPIAAGLVGRREAIGVTLAAACAGLVLSALAGAVTLAIAGLVLVVGFAYDLRLKGTPWSWVPFAAGIPLLPAYAWTGATGAFPPLIELLLPAAVMAGAALAVGNSLVDVERDRAAGISSVAVALGRPAAWSLHAALLGGVVAIAGFALVRAGADGLLAGAGLLVPAALLVAGLVLARASSPASRERGWELEAVGVALLAAGWFGAVIRSS